MDILGGVKGGKCPLSLPSGSAPNYNLQSITFYTYLPLSLSPTLFENFINIKITVFFNYSIIYFNFKFMLNKNYIYLYELNRIPNKSI